MISTLGPAEWPYAWRDAHGDIWVYKNGQWGIQGWFFYPGASKPTGLFRKLTK